MIDDIIPAKGQLYHKCSSCGRVDNPCKLGASCHGHIGSLAHDNRISQRVTGSHILVKGHRAQEQTLCCPHGQAKEHLHSTARGDGLFFLRGGSPARGK